MAEKMIWIARGRSRNADGRGSWYYFAVDKPKQGANWYGGQGVSVCSTIAEVVLPPKHHLEPGEGPKQIAIKLG